MKETKQKSGSIFLILAIVVSCFLALYNSVAMNMCIPPLMNYFHTDVATIQWIMISYTLMMGVLSPLAGYFSDKYSCRNIYSLALVAFAAVSFVSGICSNIYALIGIRLIQGGAAAVIMPCSMMVVYQFVPANKRSTFLTVQTMAIGAGPGFGPVLAGFLTTTFSWRWAFWINVPLALFSAWALYRYVPYATQETADKPDVPGFMSVIIGTILFLMSFNMVSTLGVTHPGFWAMLIGGLGMIFFFVFRCIQSERPALNFGILREKDFTLTLVMNSCLSMALCLVPFVLAIYFQTLKGYTAFASGLILMIPAMFSMSGGPIAQILYRKIDGRVIITVSMVMVAVGSLVLSRINLTTSLLFVLGWLCMRYFGLGLSGMPLMDYGMSVLPRELSGHGSSLINWFKSMATGFSLSLFTMIMNLRVEHYSLSMDMAQAQMKGIDDLFLYSGLIIVANVMMCALLKKKSKN